VCCADERRAVRCRRGGWRLLGIVEQTRGAGVRSIRGLESGLGFSEGGEEEDVVAAAN